MLNHTTFLYPRTTSWAKFCCPETSIKRQKCFTFHVWRKVANSFGIKQQLTANCTVEAGNKYLTILMNQESAIFCMKWKHRDFPGNSGKQWSSSIFLHVTSVFYSAFLFSCCSEALLLHKKKKKIPRNYVGSAWVLCVTAAFFGCVRVRLVQYHLPGSSPLPVWLACQSSLLYIYMFSE